MKAYAIEAWKHYFLVYAQTGAQARGMVIRLAWQADVPISRVIRWLRCRRWPERDDAAAEAGVTECLFMPDPFSREYVDDL